MDKVKKVPALRFPWFSGEWEVNKLRDICNFYSWGTPITSEKSYYNGTIPFIKSGEISLDKTEQFISELWLKNSSAKIINKGSILYALYGATSGEVAISKIDGAINQAVLCIKSSLDHYYLYSFLKLKKEIITTKFLQWWQGNLSADIVKSLKINFPEIKEQQKIADFLTQVDKKIEQLTKKKQLLENYKKWVMQKIFSQELRFKDDNGEDYPDWEEKKLKEIWSTYNGLTGKNKENFWCGYPYVTYKQIFDKSRIDIKKFELVEIELNENQNLVKYGDVFFTTSSETPNEVWFSSVILDEINNLYLNSFCFWYRWQINFLKPVFSQFLFRNSNFRKDVIKLAQWSTRYNMSKVQFIEIKINLPFIEEQTKIAGFLTEIDNKINHVTKHLEGTKQFKNGLLQKMFV